MGLLLPALLFAEGDGHTGLPSLSLFGFTGNKYDPSSDIIIDTIPVEVEEKFGIIEDDPTLNVREFYTAYLYSPIKIEKVEKVMPKDSPQFSKELYLAWKMASQAMNHVGFNSPAAKQDQMLRYATIQHDLLMKAKMSDTEGLALFNATVPSELARMLRDELNKVELGVLAMAGATDLVQVTRLEDGTYEVRESKEAVWDDPRPIKELGESISFIGNHDVNFFHQQ
jgi:hypothetical protein